MPYESSEVPAMFLKYWYGNRVRYGNPVILDIHDFGLSRFGHLRPVISPLIFMMF